MCEPREIIFGNNVTCNFLLLREKKKSTRFDVSMIKKKKEIRDKKGIKVWNKASKERNVDLTPTGRRSRISIPILY